MTTRDDMLPGARTAVVQCLGITNADRVFIMTDDETLPIGEALLSVTIAQGATCRMVRLEEFGQRPFLAPARSTHHCPALVRAHGHVLRRPGTTW